MFCYVRACIERLRVTFPLGSRDICLLQNVQTSSRAHKVCYSVGQFSESTPAREWSRLVRSIYLPGISDITMKAQVSTADFRPDIRAEPLENKVEIQTSWH